MVNMEMEEPAGAGAGAGAGARCAAWARRRLPVLRWAPRYSGTAALADLVAGVTLGLTLVPQSIAYAALADLPVQYGLYSAFVGTIVYVPLGTVKEVSIGPTSLMALLTLQTCHGLSIEYVVLLTFLSGCVVLAMGLLRLGFLTDLISPAVTSGFTSATAVIIVVAQLKGLLGVSFLAESPLDNLALLAANRHRVSYPDAALAAACCATLLALRKLSSVPVPAKRRALRRALWLASISRNALAVLAASALAYTTYDHHNDTHPLFKLSGRVEPGLPPFGLPAFSVTEGNVTLSFLDMARRLGSGVLMLPVLMVLANIAIAKAFSDGGRVDATQEMVTLGLCNMLGALVHAMPTCGAFTRSAVSHCSGVRTPLASLYSGLITLLALAFMTQYFYFIPKACLSSVLICAVIFMLDIATVRRLWRESRGELAVLALTFAVSLLLTVELGLLAGVLASLARVLRKLMRPDIRCHLYKWSGGEAAVARLSLGIVYLSAEHVGARLAAAAAAAAASLLLVDCADFALLDHAGGQALESLITKLKAEQQQVVLFNASAELAHKLQRLAAVDARALRCDSVQSALAAVEAPPAPAAPTPAPTTPLLEHSPGPATEPPGV